MGGIARRVLGAVSAWPLTSSALGVYLLAGVATGALWDPVSRRSWFPDIAYGVPALAEGRWWTPLTGAIVSIEPWHYALLAPLLVVGLGVLERRRGPRFAIGAFAVGQVGGVLAALAVVDVLTLTGWGWAERLATVRDVGPSCGVIVALALGIASLPSPWRLRGRLLLGSVLLVAVLLHGSLADVEHAIAGGAILAFGFGFDGHRATRREWRLLGFVSVVAIGALQILAAVLPTSGPLGPNDPGEAQWWDVAIDVALVAIAGWGLLRGRRWAWWIAIALAAFNVLEALVVLTVLDARVAEVPGAGIAMTASVLWLVAGALLLAGRRAFAVPLRRGGRFVAVEGDDVRSRVVAVLEREGGGTLSWMATWPRMRARFGPEDAWVLPVRRVGDVAIVLGDPIGPRERWAEAIAEFRDACERADVTPCCFSATAAVAEAAGPEWRSLGVGEDTIVDLPGLEFTGGKWQPVRGAANRAEREGIAFRLTRLADEPWAVLAQVRAISEQWVGDKGLPEMGFTLGGVDEALDPRVRTALAVDAEGSVHGVLSWLPVYGAGGVPGSPVVAGWVLDVMRRRDGGFGPVMEFLIGQSLLAFRDEGARFASLSGAPLAQSAPDADEGVIGSALETVARLLEPAYGFASLHRFKQKFHPRTEPFRLIYPDESALPRIAAAIARAYLPDATPAELARAGLSLLKR